MTQFTRELTTEGYGTRLTAEIVDAKPLREHGPITIQTYAWFARHVGDLRRDAYQLVICDEAHTALGEKTSAAIRSFPEPIYIGMTATEQLIAKQVSDVFPASVDDLPLQDAARRGLIAPLRCLRVPPVAAINSVPIVGGDFDQQDLAKVLDHQALNQAAASLYRDRFDDTPGIVYAAGVDHAYNLAQEFRAAGLKAEAVSGRTPPVQLAETLAAYERGEINVLINAHAARRGLELAARDRLSCTSRRPRSAASTSSGSAGSCGIHPRKEAGIVVDFVNKGATHSERVVTLHSLLDADFYREGARVIPTPRRRIAAPRPAAPHAGAVARPGHARRQAPARRDPREWQRIDPRYLDEDEQRYWATFAGRKLRFEERDSFVQKFTDRRASKAALEQFLFTVRGREPEPAAADDGARRPRLDARRPGELRRSGHARHAGADVGEGRLAGGPHAAAGDRRRASRTRPEQILARWTWRLARATRKALDRQGERRVSGGEAAARRARQLARPPARGERGQARRRGARAAAARRRCAARVGGRLHAARDEAARRGARGDRDGGGDRARARRGPARAEAARAQQTRRRRRRKGGVSTANPTQTRQNDMGEAKSEAKPEQSAKAEAAPSPDLAD